MIIKVVLKGCAEYAFNTSRTANFIELKRLF